jgi:hypothetical protein
MHDYGFKEWEPESHGLRKNLYLFAILLRSCLLVTLGSFFLFSVFRRLPQLDSRLTAIKAGCVRWEAVCGEIKFEKIERDLKRNNELLVILRERRNDQSNLLK